MKKLFLTTGLLLGVATCALYFFAYAADYVKTNQTLVYSSNGAVASVQNATITLYIGDNLAGVTSPIKSAYLVASGVYTGGGTVSFTIDGDGATTQTFTLPNVGTTPTSFEFIYKDPSNKMSPTSAGEYTYSLLMTPSGVTLYGFAVKMTETHQYAPTACPDGTTDKVKTNEALVYSSHSAVASGQNAPFSVYIGDDMAGITNPVKSLYFVTSGVYTGNGTLTFSIDSDAATIQTFTLPDVGSIPTSFELMYKDPSNKVNPTSAGEYTYVLNIVPSAVTLYGLGVKMVETHQYAPGGCGGLPPFGDLISSTYDTGVSEGVGYNSIMWKGVEGTGKVKFQLATSNCQNGASNAPTCSTGTWNYLGGATCQTTDWYDTGVSPTGGQDKPVELTCAPANHNNQRYYRYKIRICSASNCTDAGTVSPVVDDVIVNWAP